MRGIRTNKGPQISNCTWATCSSSTANSGSIVDEQGVQNLILQLSGHLQVSITTFPHNRAYPEPGRKCPSMTSISVASAKSR